VPVSHEVLYKIRDSEYDSTTDLRGGGAENG